MEIKVSTQHEQPQLRWEAAVCATCGQPFISRKALRVHISTSHRVLVKKRGRRKVEHGRRRRAKLKKEVAPSGSQITVREVREGVSQSQSVT